MNNWQLIIVIVGIPFVSVIIEKLLFAFWQWLRRNRQIKNLIQETSELRQKIEIQNKRIADYKDQEKIKSDLEIYENAVYRSKSSGQFFCMLCLDKDGKKINVVPDTDGWFCYGCSHGFYPKKRKNLLPKATIDYDPLA